MYKIQIVESTHIADFCAQWMDNLTANWKKSIQATLNAGYSAVMQCLHCLLFTSRAKAARGMGESFTYYVISEALELTSSLDVRMAAAGLLIAAL